MSATTDPEISPPRFEDFFDNVQPTTVELLGTLKVSRQAGSISVVVRSRKLTNCVHNWKKFLFTVLPASAGAIATIPTSSVAAAIVGLQAIKSAIETAEIEFSSDAGVAILLVAEIQRAKEAAANAPAWVSLAEIEARTVDLGWSATTLLAVLADLERLRVVCWDLDGANVRVVEELRFET